MFFFKVEKLFFYINSMFYLSAQWALCSLVHNPRFDNIVFVSFLHGFQDLILTFTIFNSVLINNIKSWYYETTHWDESNKIPHEYVFLYIQIRIFGHEFLNLAHQKWSMHYIMERREYLASHNSFRFNKRQCPPN